jgi:O-methyltransferase
MYKLVAPATRQPRTPAYRIMKKIIRGIVRRSGFDIVRYRPPRESVRAAVRLDDLTPREIQIVEAVKPYTLTNEERIAALVSAVRYIVEDKTPGDLAECGVWRGGSIMAMALSLMYYSDSSRHLYLYDTFEGMSAPTEHDQDLDGQSAHSVFARFGPGKWVRAPMEDVRANVLSTGFPEEKVHFVKGKVEETLPAMRPDRLALLRLDTDWYESTKHELIHLFPLLESHGILIVDDYGHWKGARKAVDEYVTQHNLNLFLHRVDYTCRIAIRTDG